MEFNFKLFLRFLPQFFSGYLLTLKFAAIGIVLSLFVGLFVGIARCMRIPVLSTILKWYIDIFRETPLLVQMYLLYYGLPYLGVMFSAEVAGMLAIILNESAFIAEIIRGGIESISPGQEKAGLSLGFSYIATLFRIIIPQALKSIYPSLAGQASYILKDTSLLTLVTIVELTSISRQINSKYLIPGTAFIGAAVFYIATFWLIQAFVGFLQRRQKWS